MKNLFSFEHKFHGLYYVGNKGNNRGERANNAPLSKELLHCKDTKFSPPFQVVFYLISAFYKSVVKITRRI